MRKFLAAIFFIQSFYSTINSQTYIFVPGLGSANVFLNPAFAGTSRCTRTGGVSSFNSQRNMFLGQEVDLASDFFHGGIGLTVSQSWNQNLYRSNDFSLLYSYAANINRHLTFRAGAKYTAALRSFNFSDVPPFSAKPFMSAGGGLLLYSKSMVLAAAADQLNQPGEGNGAGSGFKMTPRYTAQATYHFRPSDWGIATSAIYEYQAERFFIDSLHRALLPAVNYGVLSANFNNNQFTAGLGYRYHFNAPPEYLVQAGMKTRKFSMVYNLALSRLKTEINSKISCRHQVSLEYILQCKMKKRRFVAYRSLDGGGGYHVSSFYRSSYSGFLGARHKVRRIGAAAYHSSSYSSTYSSDKPYHVIAGQSDMKPGTLTAGEVNDFNKWDLWEDVEKKELFSNRGTWNIYPEERFSVIVFNKDKRPVIDAEVQLLSGLGDTLWQCRTDASGKAELWNNLFGGEKKATEICIKYRNKKYAITEIEVFGQGVNTLEVDEGCELPDGLDVMFVVDGTTSMDDEITYLRVEMNDILTKIKANHADLKMRTASLFYMCPGNSYVTKHSPFSDKPGKTIDFIKSQSGGGGGTEAVETAVDEAVNQFDWNPNARARIMFLVLDEPPGTDADIVIKMHKAIADAAKKGIKIIPVGASGIDKSTEYLMRCSALATNGTYVFLTDHSNVGNPHIQPTTDEYDVTYLNQLLVNLVKKYCKASCSDSFDKSDLSLSDTGTVEIIDHVIVHSIARAPKNLVLLPEFQEKSLVDTLISNSPDYERVTTQVRKIKFYPNPCHGNLDIEAGDGIREVFLSDENNKLLEKFVLDQRKFQVDLSKYPNGIYFLQYFGNEKTFSGKLIINR